MNFFFRTNFVERRMDNKIRIEYMGNFALEIPNKIKISELIIIIDINQKTIKIGMINPSNYKPIARGHAKSIIKSDMMSSAYDEEKLNQAFEQEFELIQNFDDFIFKKID